MEDIKELQEKLARYEQREKELELRVEELTGFVEHASMPLHWVDHHGIITWANQAELDLLGYKSEEYIGYPIYNFHADQLVAQDIFNRLSKNETLYNYPAKLRCKGGDIRHVLINSNILERQGKFIHTRCFTKDVTAFIKEEERLAGVLVELEQSEARLRMAIGSMNLGTWDFNPLNNNLYWSAECKAIFGYPAHQSISYAAFKAHVHPDDIAQVELEIEKSLAPDSDGHYDIIYRFIRFDDGRIIWVRVRGQVYKNTEGQSDRFIGTILDISDTKLAQEKISRNEKLFRSIALNIPKSLVIVIDKDHRYIAIEGDIMQRMGYDSKNYEGKHPTEVGTPERYESARPLYERMMAGEKFSVMRKAETGEDYMVHFVPLKNDREEVDAGLIIVLDITEIKQSEERSAKLAAIIESSDDAIISKTLEGIITSWNDSAVRTFGYTADEMIGQPILKLIPEDLQQEESQILSRLRNGERVKHFETKRMTKTGKLLDISLTISPVRDTQGNIIGLSKIARDITEKKQEEIRKNDFIAMVSHELKTPLTSMRSYVQVLLAKALKDGDSFSINALTRAEIQAKKMTAMILDFLSLARLEEGKIPLNKELFALHTLIEETAGDAQFLNSSHIIRIMDCGEITINADRDKIGQVLTNLLSNAVKYSPKGSTITVGCEKQGEQVKIFVSDEGVGINEDDQKRLFERFYRSKNEKIKTVSGFGIGLYLVSEILRYHDAKIEVESQEGMGSTFYFNMVMCK